MSETQTEYTTEDYQRAHNAVRLIVKHIQDISDPADVYCYLHIQAVMAKKCDLPPNQLKMAQMVISTVLLHYEQGYSNLVNNIGLMRHYPDLFIDRAFRTLSLNGQLIIDTLSPQEISLHPCDIGDIYESIGKLSSKITELDKSIDVYDFLARELAYLSYDSVTTKQRKLAKIVVASVLSIYENGYEGFSDLQQCLEYTPNRFFLEIEKELSDRALELLDVLDLYNSFHIKQEHIDRIRKNVERLTYIINLSNLDMYTQVSREAERLFENAESINDLKLKRIVISLSLVWLEHDYNQFLSCLSLLNQRNFFMLELQFKELLSEESFEIINKLKFQIQSTERAARFLVANKPPDMNRFEYLGGKRQELERYIHSRNGSGPLPPFLKAELERGYTTLNVALTTISE